MAVIQKIIFNKIDPLSLEQMRSVLILIGCNQNNVDKNQDYDILEFEGKGQILIQKVTKIFQVVMFPPTMYMGYDQLKSLLGVLNYQPAPTVTSEVIFQTDKIGVTIYVSNTTRTYQEGV